jgi:hypothetical protein
MEMENIEFKPVVVHPNMSSEINELAMALAIAQGEMEHAKKEQNNPFFKSKYADLSAIVEQLKKVFPKNGLSYSQLAESDNGNVNLTTILMHKSGQWIKSTLTLKPVKADPQGYGSAITYARRYSLQSIAGLSAEADDDAEAAMGRGKPAQKPKKAQKVPEERPTTRPPSPDSLKSNAATDAQRRAIYAKGKEHGLSNEDTQAIARWYRQGETMTKQEASQLLDNFDNAVKSYYEEMAQEVQE